MMRPPLTPVKLTSILVKTTLASTAIALLSGCQVSSFTNKLQSFAAQPVPGPKMPAAPLPTYNVGDLYYYSNGAREQVISVDGEVVSLITRAKRKISNFRNFTLPPPYIEGKLKEYYKSSDIPTNTLWPLRVGNKNRYGTDGKAVSKAKKTEIKFSQSWKCNVEGTERVRVLAGVFDTYRIKCQRYSTTSGRWWQDRTWNYSPLLGTYVLRRDFIKKRGERIRQLTALRPSLKNEPKHVLKGVVHAWQTALETKQAGDLISWTDPKTGTSVQIEPLSTYRASNGQFCRTYKQYLTRHGETRIYSGVACRTGKMQWRTPRRG